MRAHETKSQWQEVNRVRVVGVDQGGVRVCTAGLQQVQSISVQKRHEEFRH